jgi:uroporphyrinogen decarboxylase
MTSRERVRAAIAHQSTDCLPHCIGCTSDMKARLAAELRVDSEDAYFDNDVIRVFPPWWQWIDIDDSMHPWYTSESLPDARPTVKGARSYEPFFADVTAAHEAGRYVLACIYGSHFEKANFARGIENFLADMAGDPEGAGRFLDDIIRRNLVMLDNFLACPEIDGVLLGSDWGSQASLLMSPTTWNALIRPGEQAEYDLIKSYGKHVWIHSCGCITAIIPSLIEMGVDVLNPIQPECMDVAMLKREFGKDLTFWGGLSTQQTLPYGSPDDVRREAREVMESLGAGAGYIFAPAQEIQTDVPLPNVEALREIARGACGV